MKVLFFGSCDFASIHLRALLRSSLVTSSKITKIDVVTPPDRLSTPVSLKQLALTNHLHVHEAPPTTLKGWDLPGEYDMGVVVSFGYFVPARIVQAFRKGAINVHPSLLPRFRGASPIQHAILYGDQVTGVSIIELHPTKFDAGRILTQSQVAMPPDPSYASLMPLLAQVGSRDVIKVLSDYDFYEPPLLEHPKAPKLTRTEARIQWHTQSASQIYRTHRALGHQYPLHCCHPSTPAHPLLLTSLRKPWETQQELGMLVADVPQLNQAVQPGALFYNAITRTLFVRAGGDTQALGERWLGVKELCFATRGGMDAAAFASVFRPRPFVDCLM